MKYAVFSLDTSSIHRDYEDVCRIAGIHVAELLARVIAERALTKADPMDYIAYVTALAAENVNLQTK